MPAANPVSPAVTPLDGKTTIDDKMFFEPERLSYESAGRIAEKIARKVRAAVQGRLVVIAGTSLLADLANLQAVYLNLDGLRRDYDALASHAAGLAGKRSLPLLKVEGLVETAVAGLATGVVSAAIAPAATLATAALGLVSLFRQDVEFHGAKTALDPLTFELALAAKVKAEGGGKVYVPDLMVVPLAEARKGSLRARFELAQNAKAAAWASVGPLISELVRLDARLDEAARMKNQAMLDQLTIEVSELRRDMQPVADPIAKADQRLADLQNQWNQADASTGLTTLARLLRAEAIHALHPLYLHAAVVSSGGHYRISRSLWRTLFQGDGLSFSGGATARWALLEHDGSVAEGGMLVSRRDGATQSFQALRRLIDSTAASHNRGTA